MKAVVSLVKNGVTNRDIDFEWTNAGFVRGGKMYTVFHFDGDVWALAIPFMTREELSCFNLSALTY